MSDKNGAVAVRIRESGGEKVKECEKGTELWW